jgi:hypothetical protein
MNREEFGNAAFEKCDCWLVIPPGTLRKISVLASWRLGVSYVRLRGERLPQKTARMSGLICVLFEIPNFASG